MYVCHVQCLPSKSTSDPRTFIFEIVSLKETWAYILGEAGRPVSFKIRFSLLLQFCNYRSLSLRLICLCACVRACVCSGFP